MLDKLRGYISNADQKAVLALGTKRYRLAKPARLAFDGRPIELQLGKKKLHLHLETGVSPDPASVRTDWILVDPERFYSGIAGFIRIKPGEKIIVGRGNEQLENMFGLPKSVAKRHLSMKNERGQILVKPLDRESETYLSCVEEKRQVDYFKDLKRGNLKTLRRIFGGPIEPLSPKQALATIEQAIGIFKDEPYRARDSPRAARRLARTSEQADTACRRRPPCGGRQSVEYPERRPVPEGLGERRCNAAPPRRYGPQTR